MLDGISPPSFGAAVGSFPAMDMWVTPLKQMVKVIDFSHREGGAIEQYTF